MMDGVKGTSRVVNCFASLPSLKEFHFRFILTLGQRQCECSRVAQSFFSGQPSYRTMLTLTELLRLSVLPPVGQTDKHTQGRAQLI